MFGHISNKISADIKHADNPRKSSRTTLRVDQTTLLQNSWTKNNQTNIDGHGKKTATIVGYHQLS